jgi:hypothetical protein
MRGDFWFHSKCLLRRWRGEVCLTLGMVRHDVELGMLCLGMTFATPDDSNLFGMKVGFPVTTHVMGVRDGHPTVCFRDELRWARDQLQQRRSGNQPAVVHL